MSPNQRRAQKIGVYTLTEHFEKSKLGVKRLGAATSPHNFILRGELFCAGQNTARATSSLRSLPVALRVIRMRTRRTSIESRVKCEALSLNISRNNGMGVPIANDNCPKNCEI